MLTFDRFVMKPLVTITAKTVMMFDDLENSVEAIGAVDAVEIDGSPLNNMHARLAMGLGNADDLTEYAGRQCSSSWATGRTPADYIGNIIRDEHGSVMEHASIAFQVTGVSRSLTHELIRHRVGTAFSQQSQRYVDANLMRFVVPPIILSKYPESAPTREQLEADPEFIIFRRSCATALADYVELQTALKTRLRAELQELQDTAGINAEEIVKRRTMLKKRANEAARALLPNASETMLVFTTNIRALRHITMLRGSIHAEMEIRRFATLLLEVARPHAPLGLRDLIVSPIEGDEFLDLVSQIH